MLPRERIPADRAHLGVGPRDKSVRRARSQVPGLSDRGGVSLDRVRPDL